MRTILDMLKAEDREAAMKELFAPETGANFTIYRMPVGANDFSLDWHSYNENEDDFDMTKFSTGHEERSGKQSVRQWIASVGPPSQRRFS